MFFKVAGSGWPLPPVSIFLYQVLPSGRGMRVKFPPDVEAYVNREADGAGSLAGYLFPASLTVPLDAKRSGAWVGRVFGRFF